MNIFYDIIMKIFSKNIHKNIEIFAGSSQTGYSEPKSMAVNRFGFPDSFASTRAENLLPEILMERLHFNLRSVFSFFLTMLFFLRSKEYLKVPFSLIPYPISPYDQLDVIRTERYSSCLNRRNYIISNRQTIGFTVLFMASVILLIKSRY